ncbi:MAG: sulfotransferase [Xanthomonadaceae bacterium]|nr:sulfotransferase [Xanthomonadaceae bacterium]
MKLPVSFIRLPVQFDADALAREVAGWGAEHWREHPEKYPGNLWLPLIAANGDPDDASFAGPMRPTAYLQRSAYLTQVLSHLGAVWGRTRLMKLTGHAEVNPHFDVNYYWRTRMRVHVPVVTRPTVRFMCGDDEVNMAPGECWIFDTWRKHRVINDADVERIHLVADTVGSDAFGELMRGGRMTGMAEPPGWHAEPVAPAPGPHAPLRLESTNIPAVMTPWELREHIGFLLRETRPHPQLDGAQQVTARFLGAWTALWAEFGTDEAGWPAYRRAIETYDRWLLENAPDLRLLNDSRLLGALRFMIFAVAVGGNQPSSGGEQRQDVAPGRRAGESGRDAQFDRPVFIVSPPRSGSTLLFETLARARGVYTIGRESHALIEGLPGLSIIDADYASNRIEAAAASPEIATELRRRFQAEARDRDGRAPETLPLRLLEKTPKNSLRIPFLAKVFPEACFVYLYRDPRETLASMIEAWKSGRFNTYPDLPGWNGPSWSLLLTPGWRELNGLSLPEIVARQWETTTCILLDDLAALPPERTVAARYDALCADPSTEIARLCRALDFDCDRPPNASLPPSRYTLTLPEAGKWRRHEADIERVLPLLRAAWERAQRAAAR